MNVLFLKVSLPFFYMVFFILLPIRVLNANYGWSVILLFWLPSVILYFYHFHKSGFKDLKPFWITFFLLLPVTFIFEYLCLFLDIWNFSEQIDKLWGLWLWGAPIEEFVFWFGATPFCLLLYLYYRTIFTKGNHA